MKLNHQIKTKNIYLHLYYLVLVKNIRKRLLKNFVFINTFLELTYFLQKKCWHYQKKVVNLVQQ